MPATTPFAPYVVPMRIPKQILLDTNFFISLRRKEPEAINFLSRLSRKQMVTSAIVQMEYTTLAEKNFEAPTRIKK
ncbi:MAG: hypothetical protein KatS3mg070_2807 [Meiothermus sp.]|nr:MAG: hypothetical protein KatS3mg070_2807 [Meiothermus sp.]